MSARRAGSSRNTRTARGHQLWGGRFAGQPDPALVAVNRSIDVDIRLWPYDIALSKAWATALVGVGVLSAREAASIRRGLDRVGRRLAKGVAPKPSDEDVHTLIDRLLHEEAGEVASRLHTGRSRNDQVATASRMYVMEALLAADAQLLALMQACHARALRLTDAPMPAYTHLQRAQPVSAAHWMLSHFWAFNRDRTRLAEARRMAAVLPLGSGAIAGSAFRINRERIARELGFESVSPNSMDAVGDRDFMVQAVFALTLATTHMSRLAEDLILFGSSEFAFVRFADAFSTGSSMMPQKRNPDALELARSSPGRVGSHLYGLLTMLKGTPTGYNKDFQDDKRAVFDAFDAMALIAPAVTGTVRTLRFDKARMRAAVSASMMATDLADFLVRRGIPFRDAHKVVGGLVRRFEEEGVELSALPIDEILSAHRSFTRSALRELTVDKSLRNRNVHGGTGPDAVAAQLTKAALELKRHP